LLCLGFHGHPLAARIGASLASAVMVVREESKSGCCCGSSCGKKMVLGTGAGAAQKWNSDEHAAGA